MPTLYRSGSISVRMYADDHHPPHFHVVGPDFEAVIQISDLAIIAGEARMAGLAKALIWAQENKDMLLLKWTKLNERD